MTVLAIREADGPLTARETLRELLHDATEFMLGWDCIAPLKAQLGQPFRVIEARLQAAVDARYQLPPWTAEDYASHMRADRLAAACEAYPVVGWSRTDMDEALGIEIPPALRRSCSSERVCSLGAVAARAAQGLLMERFRELAYGSRSSMSPSPTPGFGRAPNHSPTPS